MTTQYHLPIDHTHIPPIESWYNERFGRQACFSPERSACFRSWSLRVPYGVYRARGGGRFYLSLGYAVYPALSQRNARNEYGRALRDGLDRSRRIGSNLHHLRQAR